MAAPKGRTFFHIKAKWKKCLPQRRDKRTGPESCFCLPKLLGVFCRSWVRGSLNFFVFFRNDEMKKVLSSGRKWQKTANRRLVSSSIKVYGNATNWCCHYVSLRKCILWTSKWQKQLRSAFLGAWPAFSKETGKTFGDCPPTKHWLRKTHNPRKEGKWIRGQRSFTFNPCPLSLCCPNPMVEHFTKSTKPWIQWLPKYFCGVKLDFQKNRGEIW